MKDFLKNCFFSCIVFIFFLGILYGVYVALKSKSVYKYIKTKQRGWYGKVHQNDKDLGFAPIPNSEGAHIFPIGPEIPMRYDQDGFRVPVNKGDQERKRPLILTLGDSFTYGDACFAEDTYPYKLAQYLNGSEINAGVGGYGLTQMYLLAQKLIPQYKPNYVVVQYAPWLVDRSMYPFVPSYFGYVTQPYFSKNKEGGVGVSYAAFPSLVLDLPVEGYKKTPAGLPEYLSFLFKVGTPLITYDHWNSLQFKVKKKLGLSPQIMLDKEKIVEHVYSSVAQLCKENNCQMIVVVFGYNNMPVELPESIAKLDVEVVQAQKVLLSRLSDPTKENYQRLYAHFRGQPPELVDEHPNALAHTIIAEELYKVMKTGGAQ